MHGRAGQRVEPLGAAFDAGIERGIVILEINRQPVRLGRRLSHASSPAAQPGDVLAVYLLRSRRSDQRALVTVTRRRSADSRR